MNITPKDVEELFLQCVKLNGDIRGCNTFIKSWVKLKLKEEKEKTPFRSFL